MLSCLVATVLAGRVPAQQTEGATQPTPAADALPALRAQYLAEVRDLVSRLRDAERAAAVADSLRLLDLPRDTVIVGTMKWLIDKSRTPAFPDAIARAWEDVHRVFGAEARVLHGRTHAARMRSAGTRDTSQKVIDLIELPSSGVLDIFDRVQARESAVVIAGRMSRRAARVIMQAGDDRVVKWLVTPVDPTPLRTGNRELMYVDLVTAPSQVASRCLAGDLVRCRDALGILETVDPLTEWYDAPERRLLVARMRDHLANGPRRAEFVECVDRHSYATCDRILRSMPGYVAPPALPPSARHHLFRLAIAAGGRDAYSRFALGTATVEQRLAAAAGMPIDSIVAHWRSDLMAARPPSPVPSMVSIWTTVAWGIAIMLLALRVVSWR